jgi:hypothetical protein
MRRVERAQGAAAVWKLSRMVVRRENGPMVEKIHSCRAIFLDGGAIAGRQMDEKKGRIGDKSPSCATLCPCHVCRVRDGGEV